MKNLAFIPARKGSKRFSGKNRRKLAGRTIVQRAIDSAIQSGQFADIVLSTDDEVIISSCSEYDNLIIDERKSELASDTATVLQALLNLFDSWNVENNVYDTVTILLPTCPFRNSEHIKEGFALLGDDIDAVISVVEYDFPWAMSLSMAENNELLPKLDPSPLATGNTRSQDREKVYHPNGGFYISRWSSLIKYRNYFKGKLKGYVMDEYHSADIDTEIDYLKALLYIKEGLINKL